MGLGSGWFDSSGKCDLHSPHLLSHFANGVQGIKFPRKQKGGRYEEKITHD